LTGFHDRIISLPPCLSGKAAHCSDTGECLDAQGHPEPFNNFLTFGNRPAIIDLKPASGAAFLNMDRLPTIRDHFLQALIDQGVLLRALRLGDWPRILNVEFDPERFYFAGQSLGAIIGALWVALDPRIQRAVFNVVGANLVDLFMHSPFFNPQVEHFFDTHGLKAGTLTYERFLNLARWLLDSVDPQAIAHLYRQQGRPAMIQIDDGYPSGDMIIPNASTHVFQRLSALPLRRYKSSLHLDLIVPVIGDKMLEHMTNFLAATPEMLPKKRSNEPHEP
jgi:hypothetical protein